MDRYYEGDPTRRASELLENLSLCEPYARRDLEPDDFTLPENKSKRASRDFYVDDVYCRSEVALPCYAGGAERHRRTCGPQEKCGSDGSCALSPRSSYASTSSDASKPSSPGYGYSYECASRASSNRTSGVSMGYDQRHASPRSSICGPAGPGLTLSPRSSISSHSSRSSRSSRGSMGAGPELMVPSPRASVLEDALLQDTAEARMHLHPFLVPEEIQHGASVRARASGPVPGARLKLPYQVTPARESGASQVERRLEALTLELEKELEMHMKKEYFGICIKCGKGVYGASQACQAMGKLYHTNCFTCCSCGRRLRGKAFYNVNGKVYCEEDFLYSGFQQTAEKCFVCGHLIMEMILQALGKSYHPGCFRCVVCKEGLDGVPFTVDTENNIYCVKDYHTVFAPKCASCCQPILPAEGSEETIRVVSMDKDYHVECYHCEDCGLQLTDEEGHRCYPLEGHLLCHACHLHRLKASGPSQHPPSYPLHVTEL
ncbi:Wilms tumor protein 1-interacting protein homolog [Trichomycterus rosablanca]|uniref:Wilms tumor protein 1-interacting protein homolog n=1 Tax=Trichomycterus rosablanca TaxID=2290929 RepID=UPI002F350559